MKELSVYIWGTGFWTKEYLLTGEISDTQLLGFIQTQTSKNEKKFMDKPIYRPDEIEGTDWDYILVCIYYETKSIIATCEQNGISLDKVFFLDCYEWIDGSTMKTILKCCYKEVIQQNNETIQALFPAFYHKIKIRENKVSKYIVSSRPYYDMLDKGSQILETDLFDGIEYWEDYSRYRAFELSADEIIHNKIVGNCAELGVYKGTFSRLINAKFSDRKLYLFDTFSSFDETEFSEEVKAGHCNKDFINAFKNTSAEQVISNMPYPDNCVLRIGLFPATVNEEIEKENFAFVSLDVDFEESILSGLRFFYPRMSVGGMIFIHDYNSGLAGVKKAVERYQIEIEKKLAKVPIADLGGTLIIYKI